LQSVRVVADSRVNRRRVKAASLVVDARHVFAGDLIITIVVGFLLFGVTGSVTYNPGLLFDLSPSAQMAWEMVMLVPLLIRR
jgi:hypothetical protein